MDKVKILDKACDLYDRSFEREAFANGAKWASSAQKNIDIDAVKFVLYNALEIGDIDCKDIQRLMTNIKKAIVNN